MMNGGNHLGTNYTPNFKQLDLQEIHCTAELQLNNLLETYKEPIFRRLIKGSTSFSHFLLIIPYLELAS